MKALRSSHRTFLTVFLFIYFGVLFISFTNLNMKESFDTDLTRTLPNNDMTGNGLYSPLNPPDSEYLASDLSLFKQPPLEDSRHRAKYGLFLPKTFAEHGDISGLSHETKTQHEAQGPHPILHPIQQNQNQRQDPPRRNEQHEEQRHFNIQANKTHTIRPTQASYERIKAGPSKEQQSLDDTEQAKAWLFEIEKDFPGLKNFQPEPLAEPFGDLDFSNTHNGGDFVYLGREAYVYSAYLDDRRSSDLGVYVRVMALLSQKSSTASVYSHGDGEDTPSAERCIPYEMCENHGMFYGGYIFSCPVHSTHSIDRPISSLLFSPHVANKTAVTAQSVNISSILLSLGKFAPQIKIPVRAVNPSPSKIPYLDSYPSESLRVHNWHQDPKTSKDSTAIRTGIFVPPPEVRGFEENLAPAKTPSYPLSFAICVSPLFGNISPAKLIEFIELSHLLGADHLYMYNFSIPASVSRILEHYKSLGLITVLQFKLPVGVRTSLLWYHGQLLANNDCLYRTMSHYDLVAFNDVDEYIVPHLAGAKTWSEAFSSLLSNDKSGFSFRSAFFDNGVPIRISEDGQSRKSIDEDLITMTSTARTRRLSQIRTKVMLCPWRVFEVGIHHISKQNKEEWLPLSIDPSLAILHHYRPCVSNLGMSCDHWTADTTVPDNYGDQLAPRVKRAMTQIFRGTG